MARRIEQGTASGPLAGTELLPGSKLSSTVVTTGSNISASAATRKFIRASGSWIADGWAVGDSGKSEGWTGGVANNKTARTVEAVTALHLTFDVATGSDIVDDAGGETVTVTKWEPVAIAVDDIADLLAAPDASTVTYTPSSNTSWLGNADPGNVDDALDQLAARLDTPFDASQITYAPSSNTSWNADADPGNVDDALDQLAVRADTLEYLITHLNASSIGFTPASNTAWQGNVDPGDVDDAINQLATRVDNLETQTYDASQIAFVPRSNTEWTGNVDPGNVDDALDMLANLIDNIKGTGRVVTAAGFRGIPQNSQSGNYTIAETDAGWHILHPNSGGAGDTFTIPANSVMPFEVGTAITFVNRDSNSLSIAITTDTMYLANSTTTGTRTLAQNGIATAVKVESTVWIISGTGLT